MVKEGYKQTELGVIPECWQISSFENCFKILSNNTLSRAELNEEEGTVKNIHYGDILVKYENVLDCATESIPYINDLNKKSNLMFLTSGDLIITDTAEDETVGKAVEIANVGEQKVVSGLHTIPCRSISPDMFADGWLGYYINHSIYHDQLLPFITGTKVSAISKSAIAGTLILVPPMAEQKLIVEALSDIDVMISFLEKLIEKKKAIKQGAMQDLLTGKKRIPGFTGEWRIICLGEISKIRTGDKNNEQKVDDGQYPFFVRSQQIERINSYSFDGEAILVPGEGNIGQIFHYVNGKFDWHQRVYKISDFSNFICGKYVYHQMKHSFGEYALKNTVKATVDSLRLPTFKNFEFWVPTTVKEQTAIASILSDMDSEIEELEQKLNKTRKLKQGMIQQLLTGKIRLV